MLNLLYHTIPFDVLVFSSVYIYWIGLLYLWLSFYFTSEKAWMSQDISGWLFGIGWVDRLFYVKSFIFCHICRYVEPWVFLLVYSHHAITLVCFQFCIFYYMLCTMAIGHQTAPNVAWRQYNVLERRWTYRSSLTSFDWLVIALKIHL